MILRALLGTFLLFSCVNAAPARTERMTISKMRMSDLETSATGYVYNQQQGHPVSYMVYTNHGSGRYYDAPDTVHYVAAPVAHAVPEAALRHQPAALAYAPAERQTLPYAAEQQSYAKGEIANYAAEQLPEYAPQLGSIKPRAPYYAVEGLHRGAAAEAEGTHDGGEEEDDDEGDNEEVDGTKDGSDDEKDDGDDEEEGKEDDDHAGGDEDEAHGYFDDYEKDFDLDSENYKSIGGFDLELPNEFDGKLDAYRGDDGSDFEAGGGKAFAEAQHSTRGEKGAKGYKNDDKFSEAEHANHDEEKLQGYYDLEGGLKKENSDTSGSYGQTEEKEKNEKDSSYGKSSYRKKGEKTNGFHNVYRKDEYKKDSDFYDDSHKEGHFDKHGELDAYHKGAEGAFKKGGKHSSRFDRKDSGKKGYYDKGHNDNYNQGHKNEEGEKSYHNNYADYATKKSSNSDKSHKYTKEAGTD